MTDTAYYKFKNRFKNLKYEKAFRTGLYNNNINESY